MNQPFAHLLLSGLLITSFVAPEIAQAQPKLRPVPANICQATSFYKVKTPDGSPLRAYGDRRQTTVVSPIPNGTTVLDISQAAPTFLVPNQKEAVVLDPGDAKRFLVPILAGLKFAGKMKVKTLDRGSSLNVRRQPTVWGSNEELIAGTVTDGDLVTVKGLNPDGVPSFLYIEASNGVAGYVNRLYLVCP
jgi:hypothetical protein